MKLVPSNNKSSIDNYLVGRPPTTSWATSLSDELLGRVPVVRPAGDRHGGNRDAAVAFLADLQPQGAANRWGRERVSIAIYSVTGQLVRRLATTALQPGENHLRWDGRDEGGSSVASGPYIYVLQEGPRRQFGKMMLLR